jgi:predicted RNA-binding protein YlqC (UPF0109 family)
MTHDEKLDAAEELMTQIARALVDHPDVAPDDVGKIIGKQGRTVRSMRTILSAVGVGHHLRYSLDVVEEEEDDDGDAPELEDDAQTAP